MNLIIILKLNYGVQVHFLHSKGCMDWNIAKNKIHLVIKKLSGACFIVFSLRLQKKPSEFSQFNSGKQNLASTPTYPKNKIQCVSAKDADT